MKLAGTGSRELVGAGGVLCGSRSAFCGAEAEYLRAMRCVLSDRAEAPARRCSAALLHPRAVTFKLSLHNHAMPICPSVSPFPATAFLQPGERPEEFATRVQRMVAARAGLKAVDWDGYMKYWKPSRCESVLMLPRRSYDYCSLCCLVRPTGRPSVILVPDTSLPRGLRAFASLSYSECLTL